MNEPNVAQVPSSYTLRYKKPEALRVAVVYAHWNSDITEPLKEGAVGAFRQAGIPTEQIRVITVPGAFELTYAAARLLQAKEAYDAVVVLGCVIRGETTHYDCICNSVTQGITELNLCGTVPVLFGLVTTENKQQAIDRSGGKYGNKGTEVAVSALQMIDVACLLSKK